MLYKPMKLQAQDLGYLAGASRLRGAIPELEAVADRLTTTEQRSAYL